MQFLIVKFLPFTSIDKIIKKHLSFKSRLFLNPLNTTSLLTPFLIGSYHEISTCLANYY